MTPGFASVNSLHQNLFAADGGVDLVTSQCQASATIARVGVIEAALSNPGPTTFCIPLLDIPPAIGGPMIVTV